MDEKKQQESTSRIALIGLVGTLLTVCGGIAGALIGSATAIYKTERAAQRIVAAAPLEDRSLSVDTHQISINPAEAAALDPIEYLSLPELGFVMAQPRKGWGKVEEVLYQDLFYEETFLSPLIMFSEWVNYDWDEQPVYRIRGKEPVTVQFINGSMENGVKVDVAHLIHDTVAYYSQVTILAPAKEKTLSFSLYDLALKWGILHQGGVNNIVANPDSEYVLIQASWELKGVRMNDRTTDLTLQRWALFAEGSERYYIVELDYVPTASDPESIWEDLQAYLDAFRVIQ